MAKIELLKHTNMVDYAMDIHKSLYHTEDVPQDMIDIRVEVVARLKSLEESAATLLSFLQNASMLQELHPDRQYNLHMLQERYQALDANVKEKLSQFAMSRQQTSSHSIFILCSVAREHVLEEWTARAELCDRLHETEGKNCDISLNGFSGAIPNVFLSLTKLRRFSADSDSFSGMLPSSLSNSPSIRILNLMNNSLTGSIYLTCTVMVHLSSLTLTFNKFHGSIPHSLTFCRKLESLNLAQNPLSGELPPSYRNLQSLSALSLTNTHLKNISAALGVLQHFKNIRLLVLTSNFNGEEIPSYPNLKFPSLEALIVQNCHLSGLIPKWLSSCSKLQVLDLSSNFLSGMIPEWLSVLNFLYYINLSNNLFTGEIPKSLTIMRSLNDHNEHLTPLEPASLGIPLFMMKYQGSPMKPSLVRSFPPTMDLSHNLLTRPIWPELGSLKNIHFLDLKWNHLSGLVPDELSRMISLEVLDLSHNNLSGTIPLSLSDLSFLSKFSIAYNHIYGMVPLGGQFSTFPCSSFEGNIGLIHDYYDNHSPTVVPVDYPTSQALSKKHIMTIIDLPFWIGLGTGFLTAVIISFKSGFMLPHAWTRSRRM